MKGVKAAEALNSLDQETFLALPEKILPPEKIADSTGAAQLERNINPSCCPVRATVRKTACRGGKKITKAIMTIELHAASISLGLEKN